MLTFTNLLPLSVTSAKRAIVHAMLDPALSWGQTINQTQLYQYGSGTTSFLTTLNGENLSRDPGTGDFQTGVVHSIDLFDVSVSYDYTAAVTGLSISAAEVQAQMDAAAGASNPYATLQRSLLDRQRQNWFGSDGDDTLEGGLKSDTLRGRGGDDLVVATKGNDKIFGGTGFDSVAFEDLGKFGNMVVDLEAGTAQLQSSGSTMFTTTLAGVECVALTGGADNFNGDAGDNCVYGLGGDDELYGKFGTNQLFGERGNDLLLGGIDDDILDGGPNNDVLLGDVTPDLAFDRRGEDQLFGRGGADQLLGGGNNDLLDGGPGRDKLNGETGDDRLTGGDDNDRFWFGYSKFTSTRGEALFGNDVITDFAAGDIGFINREAGAKNLFAETAELLSNTVILLKEGQNGPVVASITLENVNFASLILQKDRLDYTFWVE